MAQKGNDAKADTVNTALDDMSIEELAERPQQSTTDPTERHDIADRTETCALATEGGCGSCNNCNTRGRGLDQTDSNSHFDGTTTRTMSGSTSDDRLHTPDTSANSTLNTPNMSAPGSSRRSQSNSRSPKSEVDEHEDILGGEITVKLENGKPPKLSRKSSQKIVARPPPLFDNLPDSTEEAVTQFQVIRDCIYGSKYMGDSEHDALGCDCSEEWRKYLHQFSHNLELTQM